MWLCFSPSKCLPAYPWVITAATFLPINTACCTPFQAADPNNRFAMTPNGHHMFDASTNCVPTIRLSVIEWAAVPPEVCFSTEYNVYQEERYRVELLVEFANKVAFEHGILLKDMGGYVRGDEVFTKKTYVMVLDPHAFSEYIALKYEETTEF